MLHEYEMKKPDDKDNVTQRDRLNISFQRCIITQYQD